MFAGLPVHAWHTGLLGYFWPSAASGHGHRYKPTVSDASLLSMLVVSMGLSLRKAMHSQGCVFKQTR